MGGASRQSTTPDRPGPAEELPGRARPRPVAAAGVRLRLLRREGGERLLADLLLARLLLGDQLLDLVLESGHDLLLLRDAGVDRRLLLRALRLERGCAVLRGGELGLLAAERRARVAQPADHVRGLALRAIEEVGHLERLRERLLDQQHRDEVEVAGAVRLLEAVVQLALRDLQVLLRDADLALVEGDPLVDALELDDRLVVPLDRGLELRAELRELGASGLGLLALAGDLLLRRGLRGQRGDERHDERGGDQRKATGGEEIGRAHV